MRGQSRGCAACHNGVGIGGQLFQKVGVVEAYCKATGSQEIDQGRFGLTKNPADLHVFDDATVFPRWVGGNIG